MSMGGFSIFFEVFFHFLLQSLEVLVIQILHMFGKSHPKILYTVCGYCEECNFPNFFLSLLIL